MPQQREPDVESQGSGIILRKDGYILTNQHVIDGGGQITVLLKDGTKFTNAVVVGVDDRIDVAVIKVDGKDLPAARLGDSDAVKVGQWAIAIGAPYELDYSFTVGFVSAKSRSGVASHGGNAYEDYIQTDAAINPGNSGGPLVDAAGQVLGVNTCIDSRAVGIGFAVPGETVDWIAAQILQYGDVRRGALGVAVASRVENVEGQLRHAPVITRVAADIGCDLRPGDIILSLAGHPVLDRADLYYLLTRDMIGTSIPVGLWRGGGRVRCDVPIREYAPPGVVNPDE
jgi:S1-C subfamily serine protease